jgi:glycosyltransferase involved in cell wall biosynthesis
MSPNDHEGRCRLLEYLKLNTPAAIPEISRELNDISAAQGIQAAYNYLLRAEVALNLRKPSLAIYDHAFHFVGGAQKYGLTVASALQDQCDITLIANHEVSQADFLSWYNLDLSKCRIKVIKLPYFEERNALHLDPAIIPKEIKNPFHLISRESGNYDIFINNSMNEMVYPLSNISVLVCHFPERRPKTYFYADQYTRVICNSRYTAEWIENKWKLSPHSHIYPPVDMETKEGELLKNKIILSVARFEVEGRKRQREMIEAFLTLNQVWPEIVNGWKFILVGGSNPGNPYLARLEQLLRDNRRQNIALKVNIPVQELKRLYREATLFWHVCGLKHEDPSEIEHFGMTTVEAMQNKMVPLVYDGGGLKEIVDHGVNGFRVRSTAELLEYSIRLVRDQSLVQSLSESAQQKAQAFTRAKFEQRVKSFFADILKNYGAVAETSPIRKPL